MGCNLEKFVVNHLMLEGAILDSYLNEIGNSRFLKLITVPNSLTGLASPTLCSMSSSEISCILMYWLWG